MEELVVGAGTVLVPSARAGARALGFMRLLALGRTRTAVAPDVGQLQGQHQRVQISTNAARRGPQQERPAEDRYRMSTSTPTQDVSNDQVPQWGESENEVPDR